MHCSELRLFYIDCTVSIGPSTLGNLPVRERQLVIPCKSHYSYLMSQTIPSMPRNSALREFLSIQTNFSHPVRDRWCSGFVSYLYSLITSHNLPTTNISNLLKSIHVYPACQQSRTNSHPSSWMRNADQSSNLKCTQNRKSLWLQTQPRHPMNVLPFSSDRKFRW